MQIPAAMRQDGCDRLIRSSFRVAKRRPRRPSGSNSGGGFFAPAAKRLGPLRHRTAEFCFGQLSLQPGERFVGGIVQLLLVVTFGHMIT
jgi:hypothetical protein